MIRRNSGRTPHHLAIGFACWFIGVMATCAYAQQPPSVFPAIDARGVDVATGRFVHIPTDVAIGPPGAGGLAYTRYYEGGASSFLSHNHNGYIYGVGTTCSVVLGRSTETFTASSSYCLGTFTSQQQSGSTLVYSSSTTSYTYTRPDGTAVVFDRATGSDVNILNIPSTYMYGYLESVTTPMGQATTYEYESEMVCYPSPDWCWQIFTLARLRTVYNNFGYRLWFDYPSSPSSFVQPNKVTGINQRIEYCVPSSCSETWPSATYTYSSGFVASVTNSLGDATTYSYSGNLLTEIQFADHANHDIGIGYTSNRVSSIDLGFGTWTYGYSDASGERTTTVTNPGSSTREYVSTIATGRINEITNELSETVSYDYDGSNRLTKITLPEGNYTQYTYDSRGNVTQTKYVAKSGSGLSDIVTSASFPGSCSYATTCNKPTSTTDARGYRTDYTYNTTHGQVLTITAPAPAGSTPVGSGDRPQTRFTYDDFQARYLDSGGWTNGSAVWRMTVESACASGTSPSCVGTANETRTTLAYPGSGTPNNLQPTSVTIAAGNGSVSSAATMAYTDWGDVETVDGPLSGSSDTTRLYYDAMRQVTGVVGPDPDGGGSLKHRAVRTTYNEIGQPTLVERGTVNNQGDTAFSGFSVLEKQETEYDQYARSEKAELLDGSTIVALTQFSYDNRGRPLCTVVRMNPSTFSSPPSDACTLATSGSYGADRISRTLYDNAGRVTQEQSAYGTSLAQTTAAYTYTDNGQIETLTDARSYRTTYEYDGFDRLVKIRYPHPSNTNQSSTTDYEQFTFDSYGRMTQERRRSGDSFVYSYDNLDRVTARNAPGSQPDVSLGYDLLSRTTSSSQSGNTLTTYYDALSRVTSVSSSVLGSVSYLYDAASRRSRLTYPDSVYVTYAYNTADDLTGIYQNGSTTLATFGYDDLGRRTSLTRGNGVVTSYTYDEMSRLDTLVLNASGSSYDTTFTFGYNPSSQITSRTRTNGAFDWTLPSSFSDDYTSNGLNQYTDVEGVTPGYDSRGNLTYDGSTTYTYDYDNRMITASGGVSLEFDPIGRLHEVDGASTTRFLYDGADMIAEYNTSGTVLRRYVHGPGLDEPLVWYEGSGTSDKRYLMADERGSVIGVTNGSGSVTTVNAYDAYGVPDSSNDGRFQYTGQMWLDDVDLYHYKARAYDPELGRFLQTDPIGMLGGINLYAYVGNDPVSFSDSRGLCRQLLESALDNYRARHNSRAQHYVHDDEIDEAMETVIVTGVGLDTSVDCPEEFEDFYSDDEWVDDFVDSIESIANQMHVDLLPEAPPRIEPSTRERFARCAIDQLGIHDVGAVLAIGAGRPLRGTKRFVLPGSSRGSSVASIAAAEIFRDMRFPRSVPTIVGGPTTGSPFRISYTSSVGRFAGRAVPFVGWGILGWDAAAIGFCSF